jgi:hypothetical protein
MFDYIGDWNSSLDRLGYNAFEKVVQFGGMLLGAGVSPILRYTVFPESGNFDLELDYWVRSTIPSIITIPAGMLFGGVLANYLKENRKRRADSLDSIN